MKITLTIASIIIASSLFVSCADKEKKQTGSNAPATNNSKSTKDSKEGIEGQWEIKRALGDMADMNVGTIYEFKGNKLTFNPGGLLANPGTTIITDSTFTFQADGNELKFDYKYKMEGGTMIVRIDGADQTFYMVRK